MILEKPDVIKCIVKAATLDKPKQDLKENLNNNLREKLEKLKSPLLEIDFNQKNCFNQTALDLANVVGNPECIQLLQPLCIVSKEDSEDKTPLLNNELAEEMQKLKNEYGCEDLEKILKILIEKYHQDKFSSPHYANKALYTIATVACQNKTHKNWLSNELLAGSSWRL